MYQVVSIFPLKRWNGSNNVRYSSSTKSKSLLFFTINTFSFSFPSIVFKTSSLKISFKLLEKVVSSKQWPPNQRTIKLPKSLFHWQPCFLVPMSLGIKNTFQSHPTLKKLRIYKSQVIIPYSISGNIHALMGPVHAPQ